MQLACRSTDRRRFLRYFSGTGLAGTLFPGVLWARWQQQPESPISAEMIAEAEHIAGLELTPQEREMMRGGLGRYLQAYEAVRELHLPNEVAPALAFDPRVAGVVRQLDPDPGPLRLSRWQKARRPDSDQELAFLPVARLARLLRRREVSSVQLTELYLQRLEHYDPKLKFVVTLTRERALRQAQRADREIARGRWRGPLHGIPWGAKDLFAVRGYPTTWGAAPYRNQVIQEDAAVVQRLDQAGAVLVAKLTLGALAMGDTWFGGRTRNPWKIEQGSSGSSAGPGSATAAGCVGFGVGTETRGSIVSPSTRNGVTGLRPTFGRVSRYGAMALSWSMDKVGPLCRSAEDCALVFSALHGADGRDPSARSVPFAWSPEPHLEGLRIGYLEDAFEPDERYENRPFDLETLRVFRERLGVELVPVGLPEYPVQALGFVLMAEAAAAFDELTRSGRDDELTRQTPFSWPNSLRTARMIPAVEYIQANRARSVYLRLLSEAWRDVDVVIAPSFRLGIIGATNLTGHPCVVVPNGFRDDGTPVSISFLAHIDGDSAALRAAHAYQQVTGFHLRHPDVDSQTLPSEG